MKKTTVRGDDFHTFIGYDGQQHVYAGKHNPDEEILVDVWTVEDLLYEMAEAGVGLTDANIDRLLKYNWLKSLMRDRLAEAGHDAMADAIGDCVFPDRGE